MGKRLSNKYGQKLLDSAKKSTTDAMKTASKRGIQKTAETTGDLVGNKIADKITSISKKSTKESYNNNHEIKEDTEITTHKKRIAILLDNEKNQPSKIRTRKWIEINDQSRETYPAC